MKYSLIENIKYLLNYSRAVVHVQADLSRISNPKDISPFIVKRVNPNSPDDLKRWLEIINEAYNEKPQNIDYAIKHFQNHLFLEIMAAFFVMDGDTPIATISIGTYKNNNKIGGDARIAVKKKYQGYGLGSFLINYGFRFLYNQGITYGESIISITRSQSIILHYRSGFLPQTEKKYFQYNKQKRSFIIRFLVRRKLIRLYKNYLRSLSENFTISDI